MATVKEIFSCLDKLVPCSMKMDFDNVGFLAGDGNKEITRILLALEITHDVIDEAKEYGAELIVTHHPLMFSLKNASTDDLVGSILVHLLGNGMSAICMHTNLDAAAGGVNDVLADILGVSVEGILDVLGKDSGGSEYGLGRYGTVEEMTLDQFLPYCKTALNCNGLRYISGGKPVHKVAVCGGSGSSSLHTVAKLGCDTFVTADVKHNGFLDARDLGINLIDAGHYSTENVVMPVLEKMINTHFPRIETRIALCHTQPEQYFV